MDDNEIIALWCKFFQEVAPMGSNSQAHAAIRLYRMAEQKGYDNASINAARSIKSQMEQARASAFQEGIDAVEKQFDLKTPNMWFAAHRIKEGIAAARKKKKED